MAYNNYSQSDLKRKMSELTSTKTVAENEKVAAMEKMSAAIQAGDTESAKAYKRQVQMCNQFYDEADRELKEVKSALRNIVRSHA